ncbi:MAG: hypothetical protein LBV16_02510 [Elusimicrobiota bacterium]|jgi:hypothetical protein|nr:hypothetical protein [Elusimicrobiota bacterium]
MNIEIWTLICLIFISASLLIILIGMIVIFFRITALCNEIRFIVNRTVKGVFLASKTTSSFVNIIRAAGSVLFAKSKKKGGNHEQ